MDPQEKQSLVFTTFINIILFQTHLALKRPILKEIFPLVVFSTVAAPSWLIFLISCPFTANIWSPFMSLPSVLATPPGTYNCFTYIFYNVQKLIYCALKQLKKIRFLTISGNDPILFI